MAMTKGGSVPNAGTPDAGYTAPTPHAANVSHQVYEAPSDGVDQTFGLNETGSAGSAVDGMSVAANAAFGPSTTQSQDKLADRPNDLNAAQGDVKAYKAANMGGADGIQFGSPGNYGFDNP